MNRFSAKKRPSFVKRYSLLSICLLLVALIILNVGLTFLAHRSGLRLDLSQKRLYSLSQESLATLSNLDQETAIYYISSPQNQDELITLLLETYASASPQVNLIMSNPENDLRITQRFGLEENGSYVVVSLPDGSRFRVLPIQDLYLTNTKTGALATTAELKITSALQYVDTGVTQSIRFLEGHGETSPSNLTNLLIYLDSRNFELSTLNLLSSSATLDPASDIVVVVSPQSDISYEETLLLNNFLDNGGRMLLLMDNSKYNKNTGTLQLFLSSLPNFQGLLARYNLVLNQDLIIGSDLTTAGIGATKLMVTVLESPLAQENGELPPGQSVVFGEASSITITQEYEDVTVTPLLVSQSSCYAKSLHYPINLLQEEEDATGPFYTGALAQKGDSKVILYSTSSFVGNEEIGISGNLDLLLTSIDSLNRSDLSLDITPKQLGQNPLDFPGDASKMLLTICIVILLPAGVLALGFLLWARRRKRCS